MNALTAAGGLPGFADMATRDPGETTHHCLISRAHEDQGLVLTARVADGVVPPAE